MAQFKLQFPDNLTYDELKNAILERLLYYSEDIELYLVSTANARFVIYLVATENSEKENRIKSHLTGVLNQYVDTVEIIPLNGFIHNDLKKDNEKIPEKRNIFIVERHLDKTNWFLKEKRFVSSVPVISFYSFKGGLGRTTALVLSAIHVARQGKRVVLVDFDLEAPGLSSLFLYDFPEFSAINGVVDFFINLKVNKNNIEKLWLGKSIMKSS